MMLLKAHMTTGNPLLAFDARTIGDHYPGIGRYAFGLRAALGERVDVTIIDPSLRNTRFPITGPTRTSLGVRSLWAQIDVPLILRDADLYYSPYFLMPYARPCPAVVTLYDATPLSRPGMSALGRLVFRLAHWLAGRVVGRVIVLSESAREEMAALGVPREKMRVCPPGVDPKFHPASADAIAQVKRKYDLPDEFWLCFGSTRWHKNTRAATEAARERTVVIVGLPNTGIAKLPYIAENDLPAVYSAARAFIFPSLREGFGLPIIEAMACGTPVVTSRTSSLPEVVGDCGILVDPLSVDDIARGIGQVCHDRHLAQYLGDAGRARARQFTWAACAQTALTAIEMAHASTGS